MLYFKQMYTMRRMEIVNDTEYKVIDSRIRFFFRFDSPFSSHWPKIRLLTNSHITNRAGQKHSWILPFVRRSGGHRIRHARSHDDGGQLDYFLSLPLHGPAPWLHCGTGTVYCYGLIRCCSL